MNYRRVGFAKWVTRPLSAMVGGAMRAAQLARRTSSQALPQRPVVLLLAGRTRWAHVPRWTVRLTAIALAVGVLIPVQLATAPAAQALPGLRSKTGQSLLTNSASPKTAHADCDPGTAF